MLLTDVARLPAVIDDPQLDPFVRLTDLALRQVKEPAEGFFIAEGLAVIARAIDAGYRVERVLTIERWIPSLAPVLPIGTPVHVGDEDVVHHITGYRVHRGALAQMRRKALPSVASLAANARRIAVLEDLKEHTNVGVIMRCAAALGFDAVIVSPHCADPLYRRAIKVSMGTAFQVPWTVATEWPQALNELHDLGFTLAALTPSPDATDIRTFAEVAPDRVTLVFGTEGPGISEHVQNLCDVRLRIPMAGGVDSLNVGAAAAVAFYALT